MPVSRSLPTPPPCLPCTLTCPYLMPHTIYKVLTPLPHVVPIDVVGTSSLYACVSCERDAGNQCVHTVCNRCITGSPLCSNPSQCLVEAPVSSGYVKNVVTPAPTAAPTTVLPQTEEETATITSGAVAGIAVGSVAAVGIIGGIVYIKTAVVSSYAVIGVDVL